MPSTFDRDLLHLHPTLRGLVPVIQERYADEHRGYRLFVAETRRTTEEQARRFADGSTKCDGVRRFSMHNFPVSYAVDLWVQEDVATWRVTWAMRHYDNLGAIIHDLAAEGHAIEWGGGFRGFYDGPHVQVTKAVLHADLQRSLTSAGYPLVADGVWGLRSRTAARAFTHSDDGRASPALFAELATQGHLVDVLG